MTEIIITTESGTDLSPEHAEALGIRVIPMYVIMGEETKADGSFPLEEVFSYYNRTKTIPTTSAVNPQEYIHFFRELRRQFPSADILHIAYTSFASSTYQNLQIALGELEDSRISSLDSWNVSGGISLICEKAVELLATVESAEALKEALIPWVLRARVSFLPATLEYLKAGGRVSNAAYLGASLLKLKPLILIKEGKLIASKKYRGHMEKVVFEYLEEFSKQYDLDHSLLYLFYTEGFSEPLFEQLCIRAAQMGFEKILTTRCGSVISCHGGQGAFGIAGFSKESLPSP